MHIDLLKFFLGIWLFSSVIFFLSRVENNVQFLPFLKKKKSCHFLFTNVVMEILFYGHG